MSKSIYDGPELKVKRLSELATIPSRAHPDDAGYDFYSTEDYILKPKTRHLFATHIAIEIPPGFYGRMAPKSGLAAHYGIDVLGGVIDQGYRGEIIVNLYNCGDKEVGISKGKAISQLVLERCGQFPVKEVGELSNTARGEGRFGSTNR